MANILLGVIGNGRLDLLKQTIASAMENLPMDSFAERIIIDDTDDFDREYHNTLENMYWKDFKIISHFGNRGLSGSVRTLWAYALLHGYDYIFHLEEDFTFNQQVYVSYMEYLLTQNPHLAQVALVRQPVNEDEASAGGMLQYHMKAYIEVDGHIEHRKLFTLNPCLYPRWVIELGWEQGWGEKEFSERLFANPETRCAYLGTMEDEPLVNHIGNYRGNNWFV